MKTTILTLIFILTVLSSCQSKAQTAKNTNDVALINSIFDKIEAQGVDTRQNLLYGYFFFDKDKSKLEELKNDLIARSYRFVALDQKDNGEFMLHVEKVEKHTR